MSNKFYFRRILIAGCSGLLANRVLVSIQTYVRKQTWAPEQSHIQVVSNVPFDTKIDLISKGIRACFYGSSCQTRRLTALNKVALIALFLFSMPLTTEGAFESFAIRSSEFLTLGSLHSFQRSATFTHYRRFGLPELAINSFSLITPINKYSAGVELWSTGDEIYNETKISTILGFRIRKTTMRINIDIYQISIKNYGSESTPGMGFEVHHNLTPWLEVSGGVDQLLLAQTNKIHEDIERKLWIHLECHLNQRTVLTLSFEKPYTNRSTISLGYEQRLNNNIGFRLLVSDYPFSQGFGLFFNFRNYSFTLSTNRVSPLGWSNSAGIGFTW